MTRARVRVVDGPYDVTASFEAEMALWTRFRDDLARSLASWDVPDLDSPASRAKVAEITASLNEEHIKWLDAVGRAKDDDALTGVWEDAWGGTLYLEEGKQGVRFRFLVVRGPTAHTGEIDGTAQWNESLGWFSRPLPDMGDGEKPGQVSIAFARTGPFLRVDTVNAPGSTGLERGTDGSFRVAVGRIRCEQGSEGKRGLFSQVTKSV